MTTDHGRGGTLFYLWLNLAGTIVFAASGATAAVARRLDLFGVVVVGTVTALGGGVFRDVVIGRIPPLAFTDWRYPTAAAFTAAAVFWIHSHLFRLRRTMLTLDAAGLALFTVVGTTAALGAQVPWLGSCVIGMITGVGGGVIRDVLTAQIPAILQREIYALASLCGAVVMVVADTVGWHTWWVALGAAVLVFGVRLLSSFRNWSAPIPKLPDR